MAAMRLRIERSVKTPKWVLCDFKKGPGGVIDLEFLAQYFQLLHFGRHRDLVGLAPGEVFARMEPPGVLAPEEVAALGGAYRFLREFESRARLLLETDRSRAPAGGEKLHALTRATADLIPANGTCRAPTTYTSSPPADSVS